jgi:hypothetical protein
MDPVPDPDPDSAASGGGKKRFRVRRGGCLVSATVSTRVHPPEPPTAHWRNQVADRGDYTRTI